MNIQRLRNLTTGRLHTKIEHIYADIEYLTGERGIMTHMLPNACTALEPWLREKLKDAYFWNGAYDEMHTGNVKISPMNEAEKKAFWSRYENLPHPFKNLLH